MTKQRLIWRYQDFQKEESGFSQKVSAEDRNNTLLKICFGSNEFGFSEKECTSDKTAIPHEQSSEVSAS